MSNKHCKECRENLCLVPAYKKDLCRGHYRAKADSEAKQACKCHCHKHFAIPVICSQRCEHCLPSQEKLVPSNLRTPTQDTWEERFAKRFLSKYGTNKLLFWNKDAPIPEDVLAFIKEEISLAVQKERMDLCERIIDQNTDVDFGTLDYDGIAKDLIAIAEVGRRTLNDN